MNVCLVIIGVIVAIAQSLWCDMTDCKSYQATKNTVMTIAALCIVVGLVWSLALAL